MRSVMPAVYGVRRASFADAGRGNVVPARDPVTRMTLPSRTGATFQVSIEALYSLMIRTLLPTWLLDGMLAGGAVVAQSTFGILLGCRCAVGYRGRLWSNRFVRIRTRLIALWNGCRSAFVFLRHRFLLRK